MNSLDYDGVPGLYPGAGDYSTESRTQPWQQHSGKVSRNNDHKDLIDFSCK